MNSFVGYPQYMSYFINGPSLISACLQVFLFVKSLSVETGVGQAALEVVSQDFKVCLCWVLSKCWSCFYSLYYFEKEG